MNQDKYDRLWDLRVSGAISADEYRRRLDKMAEEDERVEFMLKVHAARRES